MQPKRGPIERPEASTEGSGEPDGGEPDQEEPREKKVLARLIDREELDASSAPTGLMQVDVPRAWLDEGVTLLIAAPKRLVCAACEGGGCGRCDNSGAFRLDDATRAEPLRAVLTAGTADGALRVRLRAPFGEGASVNMVLIDIRPANEPSPGVTRSRRRTNALAIAARSPLDDPRATIGLVIVAVVCLALVTLALIQRE
jgi:hypothetical protein